MSDVDANAKKKRRIFAPIRSRKDALRAVREYSNGFFVVAAIQGGIGAFLFPGAIVDAVLIAALATVLRKWNSRVAAVLLLMFSTIAVVVTGTNRFGTPVPGSGGRNIVLAVLLFWFAIKSIEATNAIHGKYAEHKNQQPSEFE